MGKHVQRNEVSERWLELAARATSLQYKRVAGACEDSLPTAWASYPRCHPALPENNSSKAAPLAFRQARQLVNSLHSALFLRPFFPHFLPLPHSLRVWCLLPMLGPCAQRQRYTTPCYANRPTFIRCLSKTLLLLLLLPPTPPLSPSRLLSVSFIFPSLSISI